MKRIQSAYKDLFYHSIIHKLISGASGLCFGGAFRCSAAGFCPGERAADDGWAFDRQGRAGVFGDCSDHAGFYRERGAAGSFKSPAAGLCGTSDGVDFPVCL